MRPRVLFAVAAIWLIVLGTVVVPARTVEAIDHETFRQMLVCPPVVQGLFFLNGEVGLASPNY